jgi:hypothetical protein
MEKGWNDWDFPFETTMCQPGCRMVLIMAFPEKSGDGWTVDFDVLPVHALQAQVVAIFRAPPEEEIHDRPVTVAEARERGWEAQHLYTKHSVVVISGDYGLIGSDELRELNSGCPSLIVATPWPEHEDEKNLQWAFDKLKENAIKAAVQREKELAADKVKNVQDE